jgi:hypothetical protein
MVDENAPVFSGEFDALKAAILNVKDEKGAADGITLKNLESSNSELYNQIKRNKIITCCFAAIISNGRSIW